MNSFPIEATKSVALPIDPSLHARKIKIVSVTDNASLPESFDLQNVKILKKKRSSSSKMASSDPLSYVGPWSAFDDEKTGPCKASPEELAEHAEKVAKISMQTSIRPACGVTGRDVDFEEDASATSVIDRMSTYITMGKEYSQFHGGLETKDYLGRTYMNIPISVPAANENQTCYLPKKCIYTWEGHQKAVSSIKLLPGSGHLLLSASFDSKIKLWETYGDRKILRTFYGHNKAVKEATFNVLSSGEIFASCSYDKTLKIWNTETGSCQLGVNLKGYPYCLAWHPSDPNVILAGLSNRKIYAWDIRNGLGDPIQEFSDHHEAVNSICFLSKKKFVTVSDDKTIRIWDYDTSSTAIKTISDPTMHAMPSVRLHPSRSAFAVQCMDNQIRTWTAGRSALIDPELEELGPMVMADGSVHRDKYRSLSKTFTGHVIAGNACQISFSPDGQYIMSGDAEGRLHFWNWRSGRIAKQLKCHNQVLIGAEWLPREPCGVVTCSWDGKIKLWG